MDELGVVVDVGGDEVAVDGEVDAGELGGVFPGVGVEGVQECGEEGLGVDEVFVGGLVGVEGGDGAFEVEGEAFEDEDDDAGGGGGGDFVVLVGRGGVLVGVGGHGFYRLALSALVNTSSWVCR